MRKQTIGLLAGIAGLALAGSAMATTPPKHSEQAHILNVAMPDGTIEQIRYTGETPPAVVFTPARHAMVPVAFDMAPFAEFDRIAAAMDLQMDAMLRQASTMASLPVGPDGKIDQAALAKLPAGTVQYSFVSSSSANGTCSRSVQMTSFGPNQPPKVVSQSSGDCAGVGTPVTPVVDHAAPAAGAKVITAKHEVVKDTAPPAQTGPTT